MSPILTKAQEEKLHQLTDVFLTENQKLNLSAFRTAEHVWTGNILDSIALLDVLPLLFQDKKDLNIVDIGTGGGFPLLPLAMVLPDAAFFGIDSIQKKIDAIGRMTDTLQLTNVSLMADRLENVGHDARYREAFDLATARAVADTSVLLEYMSPLVRSGGYVVLWKSMSATEEIARSTKAQSELSCKLQSQHPYTLPGDFGQRQLLVFKKIRPLGRKYPREVGVPKMEPLN